MLVISVLTLGILAFADDNVELNEQNFPDANFRDAIALMYDVDTDGYLSKSERNIESM